MNIGGTIICSGAPHRLGVSVRQAWRVSPHIRTRMHIRIHGQAQPAGMLGCWRAGVLQGLRLTVPCNNVCLLLRRQRIEGGVVGVHLHDDVPFQETLRQQHQLRTLSRRTASCVLSAPVSIGPVPCQHQLRTLRRRTAGCALSAPVSIGPVPCQHQLRTLSRRTAGCILKPIIYMKRGETYLDSRRVLHMQHTETTSVFASTEHWKVQGAKHISN